MPINVNILVPSAPNVSLVIINVTTINVLWNEPSPPNGIIMGYYLFYIGSKDNSNTVSELRWTVISHPIFFRILLDLTRICPFTLKMEQWLLITLLIFCLTQYILLMWVLLLLLSLHCWIRLLHIQVDIMAQQALEKQLLYQLDLVRWYLFNVDLIDFP